MLLCFSTFSDSAAVTRAELHENKCKLLQGFWRNVAPFIQTPYLLFACWKSVDHLVHRYLSSLSADLLSFFIFELLTVRL